MCGIAGFWAPGANRPIAELESVAAAMAACIPHRGPDHQGVWAQAESGIAFSHRRLSILDLSAAANQPLRSRSGRTLVCYNGEIYNHVELRERLESEGVVLSGRSDTEILVEGIEHWGLERTLERVDGMFAFAHWDVPARTLSLARDRMGEKPLHYGWLGGTLVFASELKSLRSHPAWDGALDPIAVRDYLTYGFISGPRSVYAGIRKLEPGCWARWTFAQARRREAGDPRRYWRLPPAGTGREALAGLPEAEVVSRVERVLEKIVSEQMMADVRVGAFLSGGVDSSLVVALAQSVSSRSLRTFTIGFDDPRFNEAGFAREIARYLGTEHTDVILSVDGLQDLVPALPSFYDEPLADASLIPTLAVARMAGQHVRVALSGDGGDELFGGYNRHVAIPRVRRALRPIPGWARRALSGLARGAPGNRAWIGVAARWAGVSSAGTLGQQLEKASEFLGERSLAGMYRRSLRVWPGERSPLAQVPPDEDALAPLLAQPPGSASESELLMRWDLEGYLPDDVLVKVDRATMAASLESRAPLLDRRLAELSVALPQSYKVRGGRGKWVLREILSRRIPAELHDRPKMGFSVPIGQWLRGGLRDWAEGLLDPAKLGAQGWLDPEAVRRLWDEHRSGRRDWEKAIWTVLVFQQWLEHENAPGMRLDARPIEGLGVAT
jgi:asparagine synthase (glutamine-hydrolysing)